MRGESLLGENRSEGFSNAKHAEMVNGRALAFGKTNRRNRKEVCGFSPHPSSKTEGVTLGRVGVVVDLGVIRARRENM